MQVRSPFAVAGVLLTSAAGLLAALLTVPRLEADTSLSQLFPEGSRVRREFQDFNRAFGTDDILLVAIQDHGPDPVFNPGTLRLLRRVVRVLESRPGVEAVISLANLPDLRILGGVPIPGSFLPEDPADLDADVRRRVLQDPFLADALISRDGRTLGCWVLLEPGLHNSPDYLERAEALAAAVPGPERGQEHLEVLVTGLPLLQAATQRMLRRDGRRLLAGAVVVVGLVALLGGVPLGTLGAWLAAWPLVVGALAVWMWTAGRPLHVFSSALLPLLLITSGAVLVHVGRALARSGPRSPETRRVLKASGLGALTTALGFGSLAASPLASLARLGVEMAVGALLAFAATVLTLRVLAPAPRSHGPARDRPARLAVRLPLRLVAPLVLVLGTPWYFLLPGPTAPLRDFQEALPADHPRVVATRRAKQAVKAITSFEVVVALDPERYRRQLADPDFWRRLQDFEEDLLEAGGGDVAYLVSPVRLVRYVNTRFVGEEERPWEERFRVTGRAVRFVLRWLLSPYLQMSPGGTEETGGFMERYRLAMQQILSVSGTRLRFACRVPHLAPEAILDLRQRLREQVFARHRAALPAEDIYATGSTVLLARTAREVRETQAASLLLAGCALAAVLLLAVRSLRLWFPAVAVNVLTVSGLLSLVHISGTSVGLHTAVLLATILAVAVDDTIHLLVAARSGAGDAGDRAMKAVAPSVTLSSLALAGGFAVFFLSGLPLYDQLATGAVAGIALAWFWDLQVLPRLVRPRKP